MSLPFQLEASAAADIDSAAALLESGRPGAGQAFLADVSARLGDIAANPFMFAPNPRGRRTAMIGKYPYVILFYVTTNRIAVMSVVHSRRVQTP